MDKYVGGANIIYNKDFSPDIVLDNSEIDYTKEEPERDRL